MISEIVFVPDREHELGAGTRSPRRSPRPQAAGVLDLLTSPFPIEAYLPEADLRHLKQMFIIGGSAMQCHARKEICASDERQRRRQNRLEQVAPRF